MPNAAVTPATASSNSERWISMRVVSAQACPACTQTPTALGMIFAGFDVLGDDEGRLPAEFEEGALHGLGTLAYQQLADRGRSGERHHVDARIGREQFGDVVGGGGDDVDHTRGDVGVLGDQPAESGCVPRGMGVRLEHDGVAGGQRGPQLVEDDLDREVRRGDGADDTRPVP